MEQIRRLHPYATRIQLQADVIKRLAEYANACIAEKGSFHIVLAGGSTPRDIYFQLRDLHTDWHSWHIYFGDERCLSVGDQERNDSMAQSLWLYQVGVPVEQVHCMQAHQPVDLAVSEYAKLIDTVKQFDLVILGLGEDGHTASLFPGQTFDADASVIAVQNAPKPPARRLSLTPKSLSNSQQVWFLVSGEGKRAALSQWLAGEALPASTVTPKAGVDIFTDINMA